jgi:hypothetical protein
MSACLPTIHEIPSLRVDPAQECRNPETIRIAGDRSWPGSCPRITVGYETVHYRRYTRPGRMPHATLRRSAGKRTKPRSSEVGSRLRGGKAALRNFRQVPGRSTVITQLQKARTTTYSDAAKFRTVSRIARCIRSAVRLRICPTRASSIKASVVYRTRPLPDRGIADSNDFDRRLEANTS